MQLDMKYFYFDFSIFYTKRYGKKLNRNPVLTLKRPKIKGLCQTLNDRKELPTLDEEFRHGIDCRADFRTHPSIPVP